VYIVRVLNWQAEVKVPDPAATLPVGVRIARALQSEAGSRERVSLEIYRHRGQKRYGFFLKLQASDQGLAAASAVLATARAFEAEGLPVPVELTVGTRAAETDA
jgi:hypothetical protein